MNRKIRAPTIFKKVIIIPRNMYIQILSIHISIRDYLLWQVMCMDILIQKQCMIYIMWTPDIFYFLVCCFQSILKMCVSILSNSSPFTIHSEHLKFMGRQRMPIMRLRVYNFQLHDSNTKGNNICLCIFFIHTF